MAVEYIECRDLKHPWRGFKAREAGAGFQRTLRCARCGAEKDQELNRRGHVIYTSSVRYPEGYLLKGQGAMSSDARDELRLASVRNQVNGGGWN